MSIKRSTRWLFLLVVGWTAIMVLLQWLRLRGFVHFEYEDDALYHQLLFNVRDGIWPTNTIHPLHRPSHFSPVIVLLWPLYAALGSGWMALFVLKTLLIASGALAVYWLACHAKLNESQAVQWAGIYLMAPPTIALTLSTVRPLALAVGPLLFVLWAFVTGRLRLFMVLTFCVLAFREDLGLTVATLSLIALYERRGWKWTAAPLVLGLGWLVCTTQFILPHILPASYSDVIVSSNLSEAGWWASLANIAEPSHVLAVLALLLPLLFLPLTNPYVVVGAVGIAAICLNRRPFSSNMIHLAAPAVAAMMCAAVLAFGRWRNRWPHLLRAVWVATLIAHIQPWIPPTVATPSFVTEDAGAWTPLHPRLTHQNTQDDVRWAAVSMVPLDASASAVGHLLPALSPRTTLYEYGHDDSPFLDADWLMLDQANLHNGTGGYITLAPDSLEKHITLLAPAFKTVFQRDGVALLQRTSNADPALLRAVKALVDGRHPRVFTGGEGVTPPAKKAGGASR